MRRARTVLIARTTSTTRVLIRAMTNRSTTKRVSINTSFNNHLVFYQIV